MRFARNAWPRADTCYDSHGNMKLLNYEDSVPFRNTHHSMGAFTPQAYLNGLEQDREVKKQAVILQVIKIVL